MLYRLVNSGSGAGSGAGVRHTNKLDLDFGTIMGHSTSKIAIFGGEAIDELLRSWPLVELRKVVQDLETLSVKLPSGYVSLVVVPTPTGK